MSDSKLLNFELTLEETNTILGGLSELPAKVSMVLINKLQQQAQPQLQTTHQETENGESTETTEG